MIDIVTAAEAQGMPKTDDGLTVDLVWVRDRSGCSLWRGYDPERQPAHEAGEEAFITEQDALGRETDRCSCGGLASYADCESALGILAHYPESFATELPHDMVPVTS